MAQTFPNELKHMYNEAEFIGSGGFAGIFKANRDGRIVAVKIPINYLDEEIRKSFLRKLLHGRRHCILLSLEDPLEDV